ncbi:MULTISPECIES: hypothetical protein [Leptospira]|uniref:Uncharacterized protein n=1 Tax=Leptospira limi TaxID=2950023 RepID=A0ABT3M203_9LEPT|nr:MULTISPECIES: hypothetical protein [Leptospira]MCW7464007.1 hypothetical protein [Leptospira limi]TGK92551.1 hypothetical protein EHQ34_18225 [Leptospira levettii]
MSYKQQIWTMEELIERDNSIYIIHYYFNSREPELETILREGVERGDIVLGKGYSASKHKPHTPKNQHHIHLYFKKNEISAINMDGSGHDEWKNNVSIPSSILPTLKNRFPKFKFPEGRLNENTISKSDTLWPFDEKFKNLNTMYFEKFKD